MRNVIAFYLIFLLQSCAEPKGTIVEDSRLSQEGLLKFCIGSPGTSSSPQEALARALQAEDCHRIFFLGDLGSPETFIDSYRPLTDRNPNLVINLLLGASDHVKDPSLWKETAKEYENFFFPHYYYMTDYGGLCITALDTSLYRYAEDIPEKTQQKKWLTDADPKLKECGLNIALTHDSLKEGEDPASEFLRGHVLGKFDMHISGEESPAQTGTLNKTKLVSAGGTPGYLVLKWNPLNPKRVSYKFKTLSETFPEEQVEHADEPKIIKRNSVEGGYLDRLLKSLKSFF